MGPQTSYETVRSLVGVHAPDLLPDFADRWSRWPVGAVAVVIAGRLRKAAESMQNIDIAVCNQLLAAAEEIVLRDNEIANAP